jgi:hypothetical protein
VAFDVGTLASYNEQQRLQISVTGATTRLSAKTVTLTGLTGGAIQWVPKSYTFVADSANSTVIFKDVSTVTNNVDLLLDNVRVYSSISAPYAPPSVANDAATIHPGQKVRIPVLANDSGMIDQTTLEIVSPPTTGTAVALASGEILYTHSGANASPVSFTYRTSGAGGFSTAATVNITLSSGLRIPNGKIAMPAAPPATAVSVEPAFPGVIFSGPVSLVSPSGDTKRLFVAERNGKIKVIPDVIAESPTSSLVMDLAAVVFPQPLSPTRPRVSPGCRSNDTSLTAFTSPMWRLTNPRECIGKNLQRLRT